MIVIPQSKITWIEILNYIRNNFSEDNLYFTFLGFNDKLKTEFISTFSKDNFSFLDTWISDISQAFENEKLVGLSFVCRIFLSEKVQVVNSQGEYIKIPKKKVYHFGVTVDKIQLFTVEETLQSQNTNANAKSYHPINPEPGVSYGSSIELVDKMYQHNLDVNNQENYN